MKKIDISVMRKSESRVSPGWLTAALRSHCQISAAREGLLEISPDLARRSEQAAHRGYELAKLRVERQKVGRLAAPLVEYLETLAQRAQVGLPALFGAFGVTDPDRPNRNSADGLARIARSIGLDLEDTRIMLHLGFLRIAGQTKPALAVRFSERSLSGCISKPADCFRLMRQAETKYDPQLLQELHRAEEALKAVYAETEP